MPKDTVRELRINLTSVKDHFKYFVEGMGVGSSPAGKEGRILGGPLRSAGLEARCNTGWWRSGVTPYLARPSLTLGDALLRSPRPRGGPPLPRTLAPRWMSCLCFRAV